MVTPPAKTWVEVSASALRSNAKTLKRAIGRGVSLMAVVKSNAYGHGAERTVMALRGSAAEWFGVDSVREADDIRRAAGPAPVLVLGYTRGADVAHAVRQGYRLTVYYAATVARVARSATKARPARLHLKVETGTSRQGVLPSDAPALIRRILKAPNLVLEGLSTHYANIEDTTDPSYAMGQLGRFKDALALAAKAGARPPIVHSACSAAALLYPETHFGLVRSGIALYGLWPSKETRASARALGRDIDLAPALSWKTIVAQVKRLPAGSPVSYGLTERLGRDSAVAVVPVGYWDGFDRKLSSVGRVLIRGRRAKVLGRVCMNMFVVDVTDIPGVRPEDEIVLIGRQGDETIAAEDVAASVGTINYEIVTRINPLIPRVLAR